MRFRALLWTQLLVLFFPMGETKDLAVAGQPMEPLLGAVTRLAEIHDAFESHPWVGKGASKRTCVQTSLAARDFLRSEGFDAEAIPVAFVLRAMRNGKQSLLNVTGMDSLQAAKGKAWRGHMVVSVDGFLIDLTAYQFKHPECATLPGMIACPITEGTKPILGISPLARIAVSNGPGHVCHAAWLPTPENKGWRDDAASISVREHVVRVLRREPLKQHGQTCQEHPRL